MHKQTQRQTYVCFPEQNIDFFLSAVESAKLHEAAAAAEAVEIQRKLLEAKNMVNEERIDR